MSHVFYRFASAKVESRITFDGTHISVFDLKKEVMLANKMGSGNDFELGVFDVGTGEELKEDHHQVPRSTSLLVRRLPPNPKSKHGSGTASRYIAGTSASLGGRDDTVDRRVEASSRADLMAQRTGRAGISTSMMGRTRDAGGVNKVGRFDGGGADQEASASTSKEAVISTGDAEEDARLAAMFQQQSQEWEDAQDDLSHATRVAFNHRGGGRGGHRGGLGGPSAASRSSQLFAMDPDKPPPATYICYRCGQKGHWIQACPQNDNPEWENVPRFKRTTGIPKSFLKTVEQPVGGGEGTEGVMITADGSFVMVQPDSKTWAKHTKLKALTDADIRETAPLDSALSCPIDSKLVRDAVRTPCCKTMYCEECIKDSLLDHDFVCPSCESKVASLDKLKPDEEARARVEEYVREKVRKSKEERGGDESDIESDGVKSEKDETKPATTVKSEIDTTEPPSTENITSSEASAKPDDPSSASNNPVAKVESSTDATAASPVTSAGIPTTIPTPAPQLDPAAFNNMAAMNMMMNPMMQASMVSMQYNQIQANLQNRNLPPMQRQMLLAQAQMLQQQMAQLQMMMSMGGMGMGMGMGGSMGIGAGATGVMGMQSHISGQVQGQAQLQGQVQTQAIPRGPAGMTQSNGIRPQQPFRPPTHPRQPVRPQNFRGRGGATIRPPSGPAAGRVGGGGVKRPLDSGAGPGSGTQGQGTEAKRGKVDGAGTPTTPTPTQLTRPEAAENM